MVLVDLFPDYKDPHPGSADVNTVTVNLSNEWETLFVTRDLFVACNFPAICGRNRNVFKLNSRYDSFGKTF